MGIRRMTDTASKALHPGDAQIHAWWNHDWHVWIQPRGPQDFEGGTPDGAILGPFGDSYWPTWAEAIAFVIDVQWRLRTGLPL